MIESKQLTIDAILLIIFIIIITYIFSTFENVPDNARIIVFAFILLLYDPICTSLFGRTLGHNLVGLRVRRENNLTKNILFPMAIIRFIVIVIALLGWISLFAIMNSEKRQALHNAMVKSVVIYRE